MAEIIKAGNVELLNGKVAVLGYGSQGHAHALNLHESGIDVVVGLREGSASAAAAEEAGLAVTSVADAVKGAQLVALSQVAGAQVADIGRDAITFEFVGRPDQLDAFEELVRPYGVRELVRTGRVGLRRPSAAGRDAQPSVNV